MASLILSGIAFSYVGFAWTNLYSLGIVVTGLGIFLLLAYYGYNKDFRPIVLGLIQHGIGDMIYPRLPVGYDKFRITVDFLLALYFFFRVQPPERITTMSTETFNH